jgi:hypothetical protein
MLRSWLTRLAPMFRNHSVVNR